MIATVSLVYIQHQTEWLSKWLSGKESACQCRRHRFHPWVEKIPWRRKWQPTPVFLPGKSHGQRSLVGCGPLGHRESDTTERLTRGLDYCHDSLKPGLCQAFTVLKVARKLNLSPFWGLGLSFRCSERRSGKVHGEQVDESCSPHNTFHFLLRFKQL